MHNVYFLTFTNLSYCFKLYQYLKCVVVVNRNKIIDLSKDKREMVGVFGKTGAGKSSLINAVIGKTNLLPSGDLHACTSVMIKVEANVENNYKAEIEFITKEVSSKTD